MDVISLRPTNIFLAIAYRRRRTPSYLLLHAMDSRVLDKRLLSVLSHRLDFDIGGKIGGSTMYPTGYSIFRPDGVSTGIDRQEILTWHDWFALGQLIFHVHRIEEPEEVTDEITDASLLKLSRLSYQWEELDNDPPPEMIEQLKEFLCDLDERGWTAKPKGQFKRVTEKMN
eukprot:scaffold4438_cov91-Cylindrotheca_fusiformis.AAC.1